MNVLSASLRPAWLSLRLAAALATCGLAAIHCTPGGCDADSDCGGGYQCIGGSCVASSGGGAGGGSGGGSASGDTTPPTVALTSPAAASTVHGTATVLTQASDDVGVTAVELYVDGALNSTLHGAPYSFAWDTTGVANGAHALSAIARDAAGNAGSSGSISVDVLNGAGISIHTRLGLPGPAVADGSDINHYLSVKSQYVESYNGAMREPNWVAWELNSSWVGSAARQDDFRTDPSFPASEPQAQPADYSGSGYDRGHMCPSEDRTDTVADNQATFLLTNMIPQQDNVNGGPWSALEAYSRTLAGQGKELFVVSGGTYSGTPATIGPHAVAVPSASWKVIVILGAPGQGVHDVTAATPIIAVSMPNDGSVAKSADWHSYITTVGAIEASTGLTFFSDVPPSIRAALESAPSMH